MSRNNEHSHLASHTLPEGWRLLSLGEIADTQYGISAVAIEGGTVPIIGMKNLQNGSVDFTDVDSISVPNEMASKYYLRDGDLLFNRTNSKDLVGKTAICKAMNGRQFVFASYLIRITVDNGIILPRFLAHYMNSPAAVSVLKSLATPGVSQYNINPTVLKAALKVPVPPVNEQTAICDLLESWERMIVRVRELHKNTQILKTGLMQHLLTGRLRHAQSSETEWRTYRLGDLFTERNETGVADLPLLSITGDRGVISRQEIERKDSSSADKSAYKRITRGDIGYNTMRMWQGVSALSNLEGIVSPAYTVCVPGERIDGKFASYLFKFPPIIHLFHRYSQGLVDDTLSLKFPRFAEIKVTIPGLEEQRWVGSLLAELDERLRLLREYLDCLQREKKVLVKRLVSGEVRLKSLSHA